MHKDRLVVSDDFLLDLENMEVLWHFVKFFTADGIDQGSLSSSISSDQTVFTASGELDSGINEKLFGPSDESNSWQPDVLDIEIIFVVHNSWWWDTFLGGDEVIDLFIDSSLLLGLSGNNLVSLLVLPVDQCLVLFYDWF
jgi:hypothetical protein